MPVLVALSLASSNGASANTDSDTSLLEHSIRPISENIVEIRLVNLVLRKPGKDISANQIVVRSKDDGNYAQGRNPSRLFCWIRPARFSIRKNLNIKFTHLFMTLPSPMREGSFYEVSMNGVKFRPLNVDDGKLVGGAEAEAPNLAFTWSDKAFRSTAMHVNQAGYLPDAAKFAYLTQYLGIEIGGKGEKASADFSACKEFSLVSSENVSQEFFKGGVKLSPLCGTPDAPAPDKLSESVAWELDFSDFKTPGSYRIHVKGVGLSFPFRIAEDVYNEVRGTLLRGAYHQRCGTALDPRLTRHVHPPCHIDDARIPKLSEYKKDDLDFYPQNEGAVLNCSKGHHDAGDYGKYVVNGSLFAEALLAPFDACPDKSSFDSSPLPEAGNGVPDMLDEVKWELDWISNMQDPADGGVHIIVKPDPVMSYEDSIPGQPSAKFAKQRSLWWKDLAASASFSAILAKASRLEAFKKAFPKESGIYLDKARKAWEFCMAHAEKDGSPGDGVGGHHYGEFMKTVDEHCWMAAELWLATGEEKYHAYFLKHHKPEQGWQWGWWPLREASGAATRAYVFGTREGKDAAMLKSCRDALLKAAEQTMSWQASWTTKCSFSDAAFKYGRWGWYFLSDISSFDLLLAAEMIKNESPDKARQYRQAALFNADQELGNSADDVCSFTGIGFKRPVDHVHQQSRYDGIVEPIPGIPLGFHPCGYNRGMSDRQLMASFTFGGLPVAYRYVDCWNIEQEFTVPILGKSISTYAMLSSPRMQKTGAPELRLTANNAAGTVCGVVPFKVDFKADAKAATGKKIVRYYWDISNEEFACEKEFSYIFKTPGIYKVFCTANDSCGHIAYKSLTIKVKQREEELPNKGEAFSQTAETSLHFKFDDGLGDSVSGLASATLKGHAALSDENLLWMKKPAGKSVKVGHAEDGIEIELPENLLNNDKVASFKIEAMINYQDDIPRGQGHSEIFLVYASWDAMLGLKKDTWAGKSLQGLGELSKDAEIEKRWQKIFSPAPGWRKFAIGYEADSGTASISSENGKLEFPLKINPNSKAKNFIRIGGFIGHIDEVRIDVKFKQ